MRMMNILPSAVLRSPAHRLMSRSTLILTFTGRRTAVEGARPGAPSRVLIDVTLADGAAA